LSDALPRERCEGQRARSGRKDAQVDVDLVERANLLDPGEPALRVLGPLTVALAALLALAALALGGGLDILVGRRHAGVDVDAVTDLELGLLRVGH
jgi:hypothetical protein